MWLAGGGIANFQLMYSYNGFNWTASASASNLINGGYPYPNGVASFAWNGSLWVAAIGNGGISTNLVLYSTDGIYWTNSTSGSGLISTAHDITWNGSLFIIVGQGTNGMIKSADGITWTAVPSGNSVFEPSSRAPYRICSRRPLPLTYRSQELTSKFSVAAVGQYLLYSYDSILWYRSPSNPFTSGQVYYVAWNGLMWIAVIYNATSPSSTFAYSFDGIIWTASSSGTAILKTCL